MIKRALILEAAARLFGAHGYTGTTTRLIALEAGVSEVTLFRQFGTKDALLREALGQPHRSVKLAPLPDTPDNLERELVVWCAGYLRQLRSAKKIIRKSIGEFADRPRVARRAIALPASATRMLRQYLERATALRVLPPRFDVSAAATVLSAVLFADAVGRDLMPDQFPAPPGEAHKAYVRFLLGGTIKGAARKTAAKRPKQPSVRGTTGGLRHVDTSRARHPDRRLLKASGTRTPTVFDRRRTGAVMSSSREHAMSRPARDQT